MNDLQIINIIDKFEKLIKRHQRKVSRYASIDDFKSEIFLRIRNNIKEDERTHFSYINLVAQQISSEQFKRSAFVFVGKRFHESDVLKEGNKRTIKHLSEKDDSYISEDIVNIDFIEDVKKMFSEEDSSILEMLSKNYTKEEISNNLGISVGKIYSRISSNIKPKLRNLLYGDYVETIETGATESEAGCHSDQI